MSEGRITYRSRYDDKGEKKLKSGLKGISKQSQSTGDVMKSMITKGLGIASVGVAIQKVIQAIRAMSAAYREQAEADLKMEAVLRATSNTLGTTTGQMKEFASQLSSMTGIADESLLAAEGLLATFTKIGAETFPRALEAGADMSVMFGQDMKQSMIQLGTALNDPIAGVGRLRRIGISFSQEQKDMIQQFVAMNDVASAQAVILDELQVEFGGVAREMGSSVVGASDRLTNSWGDLLEKGGELLHKVLEPITLGLANYFETLNANIDKNQEIAEFMRRVEDVQDTLSDVEWIRLAELQMREWGDALVPLVERMQKAQEDLNNAGSEGEERHRANQLAAVTKAYEEAQAEMRKWAELYGDLTRKQSEADKLQTQYNNTMDAAAAAIQAYSDPLEAQLEMLETQISQLKNAKINELFWAEDIEQVQEAILLLEQERLKVVEQIEASNKKSSDELNLWQRINKQLYDDYLEQQEALEGIAWFESQLVNYSGIQLELAELTIIELQKIAGIYDETAGNAEELSRIEQLRLEWSEDQAALQEDMIALDYAQMMIKERSYALTDEELKMYSDIIAKLTEELDLLESSEDATDGMAEDFLTIDKLQEQSIAKLKEDARLSGMLKDIEAEMVNLSGYELEVATEMVSMLQSMLGIREELEDSATVGTQELSIGQQLMAEITRDYELQNTYATELNRAKMYLVSLEEMYAKDKSKALGLEMKFTEQLIKKLQEMLGIKEDTREAEVSLFNEMLNAELAALEIEQSRLEVAGQMQAILDSQWNTMSEMERLAMESIVAQYLGAPESVTGGVEEEAPGGIDLAQYASGTDLGAFLEGMAEGADIMEIFIDIILRSAVQMESFQQFANLLSNTLGVLFRILDPFIGAYLVPLIQFVQHIAMMLGTILIPLFNPLVEAMQVMMNMLSGVVTPVFEVLGFVVSLVAGALELLSPVIIGVAIAMEVLSSPIRWLGDAFAWVGEQIQIFVWNLTHGKNNKKAYTSFSSDAFSGLGARIDSIAAAGVADSVDSSSLQSMDFDPFLMDDFQAPGNQIGVQGGNVTVNQPPPINIYFNPGNIVGSDGLYEAGEIIVMALQEYLGRGGDVSFLEGTG
jgi:hypothetical protein